MKRTTSLMLALLFSGVMLLGEAINTSTNAAEASLAAAAKLCCDALSGCGSTECCAGRGTPSGCVMICDSGAGIVCPKAEVVIVATDGN